MQIPTEDELRHLYDPVQAHQYYLRTRKLKGRNRAMSKPSAGITRGAVQPVGLTRVSTRRNQSAKAKQRQELQARVQSLSNKLKKLEGRIREMEHKEASENRKAKAKQERAAKEKDKPKTAAEKAQEARDAKQYRAKNQQKLQQNKAKAASSTSGGSSSSSKKTETKAASVSDLKALATKVKGKIAVAKQKLAAL